MYILFDIGGSKMRIAASNDCKTLIGEPRIEKTPKDFNEGMELLSKVADELSEGAVIRAAGGGIAGPLDRSKTKLMNSPHLTDWVGKPIKEEIENRLNTKVFMANDTAIVGLGEAHDGAGAGANIVVYITVSTGVGGARIVDGRIDKRAYGFEPGHQIVDIDQTLCKECKSGQLEDLVSGTATKHRFGKEPYEVHDELLWSEELPQWLAYGLNNTILHWSPDVVVLGGSMIVGDPAISVENTEMYLKNILKIFPNIPEVRKAKLGAVGGLHGALAFVRQNLNHENM